MRWIAGHYLIDEQQCRITKLREDDQATRLENRAMKVLVYLLERRNQVVSKAELLEHVWGKSAISDNAVAIVIGELRKAFGDDKNNPQYIETIPKSGYRLVCPIEEVTTMSEGNTDNKAHKTGLTAIIISLAVLIMGLVYLHNPQDQSSKNNQPILIMVDVENATNMTQHQSLVSTLNDIIAIKISTIEGWQVQRWRNDVNDPLLWSNIEKQTASHTVRVFMVKLMLLNDQLKLSYALLDSNAGTLMTKGMLPITPSMSEQTVTMMVDELKAPLKISEQ